VPEECAECGKSYAIADGRAYACASNLNGGLAACSNGKRVKRLRLREIVMDTLRGELLTPVRMKRYQERLAMGGVVRSCAVASRRLRW
jgi:hypothetical protein